MTIATTCPACSKTYNLNDNLAGKRVKCPCGATMAVAANASATPQPAVAQAALARPAATTATRPMPANNTAASAPGRSIFDELTPNDFNRSPYAVPTMLKADSGKDTKFLNRFSGPDDTIAKAEAESKSWFIFLGVVHIFWAVIYCAGAAVLLLASAALTMIEDSIPILRLGLAAVMVVVSLFAILSAATGTGILMYKPWGWWLGVYSMFWGIFERASAAVLSIADGEGGEYRIGQYVGMAVGILACISFLQLFCSAKNRKAFGIKTSIPIALTICGISALAINGAMTLVIYLTTSGMDEELALGSVFSLLGA